MKTLVFVDRSQEELDSFKSLLPSSSFVVHALSNPYEALGVLKRDPVAVLVASQDLEKRSGLDLLQEAQKLSPRTVRILLVEEEDTEVMLRALNEVKVWRYFIKPWKKRIMKEVLRNAFQFYDLSVENDRLLTQLFEFKGRLKDYESKLEDEVESRSQKAQRLNATLFKTLSQTLQVISEIINLKSHVFSRQSKRMATLCERIALKRGWLPDETFQLVAASYFLGLANIYDHMDETCEIGPGGEEAHLRASFVRLSNLMRMISFFNLAADYVEGLVKILEGYRGLPETFAEGAGILSLAFSYYHNLSDPKKAFKLTPEEAIAQVQGSFSSQVEGGVLKAFEAALKEDGFLEKDRIQVDVSPVLLKPGYVLAQDLSFHSGTVLIPEGASLDQEMILSIKKHLKLGNIPMTVRVYRRSVQLASS